MQSVLPWLSVLLGGRCFLRALLATPTQAPPPGLPPGYIPQPPASRSLAKGSGVATTLLSLHLLEMLTSWRESNDSAIDLSYSHSFQVGTAGMILKYGFYRVAPTLRGKNTKNVTSTFSYVVLRVKSSDFFIKIRRVTSMFMEESRKSENTK